MVQALSSTDPNNALVAHSSKGTLGHRYWVIGVEALFIGQYPEHELKRS